MMHEFTMGKGETLSFFSIVNERNNKYGKLWLIKVVL